MFDFFAMFDKRLSNECEEAIYLVGCLLCSLCRESIVSYVQPPNYSASGNWIFISSSLYNGYLFYGYGQGTYGSILLWNESLQRSRRGSAPFSMWLCNQFAFSTSGSWTGSLRGSFFSKEKKISTLWLTFDTGVTDMWRVSFLPRAVIINPVAPPQPDTNGLLQAEIASMHKWHLVKSASRYQFWKSPYHLTLFLSA